MSTDQMKTHECSIEPDLWLDYLENDVDESLKNDLKLHSEICVRCKKSLLEMRTLTTTLKNLPQMNMVMPSDSTFNRIRSEIMSSVEKTHIENSVTIKRTQLKVIFGATAAAFVLVFGSIFGPSVWNQVGNNQMRSSTRTENAEDRLMVESAQNDVQVFGNIILNQQDSDDLVMDAAAEKLSLMSDQEARTKIDQLK